MRKKTQKRVFDLLISSLHSIISLTPLSHSRTFLTKTYQKFINFFIISLLGLSLRVSDLWYFQVFFSQNPFQWKIVMTEISAWIDWCNRSWIHSEKSKNWFVLGNLGISKNLVKKMKENAQKSLKIQRTHCLSIDYKKSNNNQTVQLKLYWKGKKINRSMLNDFLSSVGMKAAIIRFEFVSSKSHVIMS